jgi:PKD repeat protein/predicted glutamine amidotransferase
MLLGKFTIKKFSYIVGLIFLFTLAFYGDSIASRLYGAISNNLPANLLQEHLIDAPYSLKNLAQFDNIDGWGIAYYPYSLIDPAFNDNSDSNDLRTDDPTNQDWYESLADASDMLTLDENDINGNISKKAKLTGSAFGTSYLSQEFSTPHTGIVVVRWDIYVDEILDTSDPDRSAYMCIGDDADNDDGPNSTEDDRFVYMAFYKEGGGTAGTMDLVARQPGDSWAGGSFTKIATGLNLDQWYNIRVEADVLNNSYDVYIDGILEADDIQAWSSKDSLTHISFATLSNGPGVFYVDNVTDTIERNAQSAYNDPYYDVVVDLIDRWNPNVTLAHIRNCTSTSGCCDHGGETISDPHPFYRYKNGKKWTFAHDGSVDKSLLRTLIGDDYLNNNIPFGSGLLTCYTEDPYEDFIIDSELYFLYLLKIIEENNWNVVSGIVEAANELISYGEEGMNFLLSDGDIIWAFRKEALSSPATLYYLYDDIYGYSAVASEFPSNDQGDWEIIENDELVVLTSYYAPVLININNYTEDLIEDNGGNNFETVGTWGISTKYPGYWGDNYQWNRAGSGNDRATWHLNISQPGNYKVFAWWTSSSGRASNAPYTINHAFGSTTVRVDQRINGGQWNELGEFYFEVGEYTVFVTDDTDGDLIADGVKITYVNDQIPPTVAEFSADSQTGQAPLTVQFNEECTGRITSYNWNFGDGENSTDQNPIHTYTIPGMYTVTLTVAGPGGTDSETKEQYIEVSDVDIVLDNSDAGFNVVGNWPTSSTYRIDQKINGGQWNVLDEVYFEQGSYSIVLTDDADGTLVADAVRIVFLNDQAPLPTADFAANITKGIAPVNVQFTDQSTGNITNWYWNFGDGHTSSDQNPVHKYASDGLYSVTLTVSNDNGEDIHVKEDYIEVYETSMVIDNMDGNFETIGGWQISSSYPGYWGDNYQWNSAGAGNDQAIWHFSIGKAGTHRISAWWSASSGRATNAPYTINNVWGNVTVRVNQRLNGNQWNTLGEYYFDEGNYWVVLTDNTDGTTVADAIKINFLYIEPPPLEADFSSDVTSGEPPLTVQFTDQSNGNITEWHWDFGDSETSTEQNPTHVYTDNGIYTVTLTVYDASGSETETKE